MQRSHTVAGALGPALALLLAAAGALADAAERDAIPEPMVDAIPSDGQSGKDIYRCVLTNRFDSYVQDSTLISGDRGEAAQESRLRMTWKSFRDDDEAPRDGVLSKTIVKYTHPFDLRFSGYLVINNDERPNDQFVYLAASRKIRRVNLRKEAVFGTDFTFEDIVPHEIEDGDYRRLSDTMIEAHPVYVVEITPKEYVNSEYSKFVAYVDKATCVPLRTRYWDDRDIEVKELTAVRDRIEVHEEIHWPMELTMRNLRLDTFTTLRVNELEPNAPLRDKEFEVRRLESH